MSFVPYPLKSVGHFITYIPHICIHMRILGTHLIMIGGGEMGWSWGGLEMVGRRFDGFDEYLTRVFDISSHI